jgi:hypothetical protein
MTAYSKDCLSCNCEQGFTERKRSNLNFTPIFWPDKVALGRKFEARVWTSCPTQLVQLKLSDKHDRLHTTIMTGFCEEQYVKDSLL